MIRRVSTGPGVLALPSLAVAVLLLLAGPAVNLESQVRSVSALGTAGILHEMLTLRTTASVLMVGAHPDDEDTLFIARMARGDGVRVGYFSLTRGEGGQNAIGPELFDALGVIRTEELLQARALDGGEQLFGRAFDYGFSKTPEEAARFWGEREVLGDIVRAIRQFRPLVVYSVWTGTTVDGHGHHQLVGKLTPIAFRAAADPAQFPEQVAEGLAPWQARKLYLGMGFGPFGGGPMTTTRVEAGGVDPLLGLSYAEIAFEGTSQHRSQRMGMPEVRGPIQSYLALVEPRLPAGKTEQSVFDGLDTSITGLPPITGLPVGALKNELARMDAAVSEALESYSVLAPEKSVPALARVLSSIRAARAAASSLDGAAPAARAAADALLADKERHATLALEGAAGVVVDFLADAETVAAGESLTATARVFLSDPRLVQVTSASVKVPEGWAMRRSAAAPAGATGPFGSTFPERADRTDTFSLSVPADAQPTQPYWLRVPRKGWEYAWPPDGPWGEPFEAPIATAEVQAEIGGLTVSMSQALRYRLVDPVRGELRRPVDIVPPVTLEPASALEIVPVGALGKSRRIAVAVQCNSASPQSGSVSLDLPAGWTASPADQPFTFQRRGERASVFFSVTPSTGTAAGTYVVRARATLGTQSFDRSLRVIAYPHIQTHRIYAPAEVTVCVLDLAVLPVRVGYIMGSGDQVPAALRRMGLEVTMLDDAALASGDLSGLDTIVVGVNASSTRPDFVAAAQRLLDFVREGGALVVQYQQPDYLQLNLAPYPAKMASRVVDETADVTILAPNHPVFTTPNRIGPRDFLGWVQERNLNAFKAFDAGFTPLLESHDAGEPPQTGGELYARLGKGSYVYTAYSWFRQLPAGVPGAYRLFANLVSLGARK